MKQTFFRVKDAFKVLAVTSVVSLTIVGCDKDDNYDKNPPHPNSSN